MPQFVDPFIIKELGRKMTPRELTRALRMALSAEEEAIHFYEALADAAPSELVKDVLQDIANEEKVHVGEFQAVINRIAKGEERFLKEGAKEVDEAAEKLADNSENLIPTWSERF